MSPAAARRMGANAGWCLAADDAAKDKAVYAAIAAGTSRRIIAAMAAAVAFALFGVPRPSWPAAGV